MTPTCTTVDHVYPIPHPDGTPCYCGKRRWNQDSPFYTGPTETAAPASKLPRVGSAVWILRDGEKLACDVVAVDRAEQMFKAQAPNGATCWAEPSEIQR